MELVFWKEVNDLMSLDSENPSVTLNYGNHSLYGQVFPDGTIELRTVSGGGHGDSEEKCGKLAYEVWRDLLKEAKKTAEFYWK